MPSNNSEVNAVITAKVNGTGDVLNLQRALQSTSGSADGLSKQSERLQGQLDQLVSTFGKGAVSAAEFVAAQQGLTAATAGPTEGLRELGGAAVSVGRDLMSGNWIGAAADVLGVFAKAATEGAEESAKFAASMQLTGGYAVITEGQFNSLAEALGQELPGGTGAARDALQALVNTGQVSGEALQAFGADVMLISNASGQSSQAVANDFAKMGDGVAKWAADHNKYYHFLTGDEYDHIAALEASGQKQAAMILVANDLKKSFQSQQQDLGYLQQAWRSLTGAIEDAWQGMLKWGRTKTVDDKIQDQKNIIAAAEQAKSHDNYGLSAQYDAQIAQAQKEIAKLQVEKRNQEADAAAKGAKDVRDDADVQARAKAAQARTTVPPARTWAPPPAPKAAPAESAADQYLKQLDAEGRELERKIADLNKYGEVKPKTHVEALDEKLRDTSFTKGLSDDKIKALKAKAEQDDALAKTEQTAQTAADFDKKVKALEDQAKAQDKLKGATAEATLAQDIQNNAALKGTDAAKQLAARLDAVTAANQKRAAEQAIADDDKKTKEQIDAINAETKALGLSNIERQKAARLAQALKDAEKEISDKRLTGQEAQNVRDRYTANAQSVNAADQNRYDQSRSLSTGTATAFNSYIDQATNGASQVEKVWGDAFKGTEDALMSLVTKGKFNFKGLADSIIQDLLRMEIQEMILAPIMKMLRSMMGLPVTPNANGGVVGPGGPVPLSKYATGGIATSPQLALFGEGRTPEAYVPLPDGRSIPVTMKGHGGAGSTTAGGHTFNTSVVVNSDGSSTVSGANQGRQFAKVVQAAIRQELLNQRRDGGILSPRPTGTG